MNNVHFMILPADSHEDAVKRATKELECNWGGFTSYHWFYICQTFNLFDHGNKVHVEDNFKYESLDEIKDFLAEDINLTKGKDEIINLIKDDKIFQAIAELKRYSEHHKYQRIVRAEDISFYESIFDWQLTTVGITITGDVIVENACSEDYSNYVVVIDMHS